MTKAVVIPEEAVAAGADVLADAPTIDAPRGLDPLCWHGTVRAILEAAQPHMGGPTREALIEQCAQMADKWVRQTNPDTQAETESYCASNIARSIRALLALPPQPERTGEDPDDLAERIAAKMREPVFAEFGARLDANINWPKYLTVQVLRPTAVSDWIVRILPSGREIGITKDEHDALLSAAPPPPACQDHERD